MKRTNLILALFAPESFFAAINERPLDLSVPSLLVLVAGLGEGGVWYLNSLIQNQLIAHTPTLQDHLLTLITAVFTTFLAWILVTGIFAVLSRVLYGGGEFLRLLQCTSYGFIPGFIGSIITIPVLAPFAGSIRLPALGDPQMIGAMMEQVQHTPTMQMVTIIGVIFLLWSGCIWTFGVKEADTLSIPRAAFIVGIPLIIAVAIKIIGVILS